MKHHRILLHINVFVLFFGISCNRANGQSFADIYKSADEFYCQGIEYYSKSKLDLSLESFHKCKHLNNSSNRPGHYYSNNVDSWIAHLLWLTGDTVKARTMDCFYNQIPVDQRTTLTSDSILFMADVYKEKQKYDDAILLLKKGLELEAKTLGWTHYYVANTLTNIATLYESKDDLDSVYYYSNLAIGVYSNNNLSVLENSFYYEAERLRIVSLESLGWQDVLNDDSQQGVTKISQAYDYLVRIGLENSNLGADFCHDLAIAYLNIDNFEKFFEYMKTALDLKEFLYGKKSEEYLYSLEMYATGLQSYARHIEDEEALPYLKEAKSLWEMIPYRRKSVSYSRLLNHYSAKVYKINNLLAIELSEEDLSIHRENNWGDSIPVLSNLAQFYMDNKNFNKALLYNNIVIELKLQGELDYGLAITYRRMASIYDRLGQLEKSIEYCKKAVEVSEKTKGSNSWEYAFTQEQLAVFYLRERCFQESTKCFKIAEKDEKIKRKPVFLHNISRLYFNIGDMDSCYYYQKKLSEILKEDWALTISHIDEEDRFYYNSSWRNRTFFCNALKYATESQNSACLSEQAFNNSLFLKFLKFPTIKRRKNILDNYSSPNNHGIGSSLIASNSFIDDNAFTNLDYRKVRGFLSERDIAVEIIFSDVDSLYYASIIRSHWESPKTISLGVDSIFLDNNITENFDSLPLFKYLWSPIIEAASIKEGENVYISLDGDLQLMPIESTLSYSDQYISDTYNVYRVSSTLNISEIKMCPRINSSILYGGLDYSNLYKTNTGGISTVKNGYTLSDSLSSELRSRVCYLPWSKTEVDSIASKLKTTGIECKIMTSSFGSKESFTRLSGYSPNIIHVATHGFCTPTDTLYKYDWEIEEDYLRNSGLIFSGAANSMYDFNDGILRSDEIYLLDLSNTNLLVLSACDTGKGSVFSKYGVTGLQKAFKFSGVRTIIMSLSKVDDAATFMFMNAFYDNLVISNDRYKAFKYARKKLIESNIFSDFKFWAPFIMLD